jgi:hypothetical protein
MNPHNMTLWQIIDTLAQQIPFSKQKVEAVLSTPLVETVSQFNNLFRFYESQPVELADGVVIATNDLSLKISGKDPGLLGLQTSGTCITVKQLEARYKHLRIVGTPRGHSLEEETTVAQEMPWGTLTFGFKDRKPDCLSSVGFEPKKND